MLPKGREKGSVEAIEFLETNSDRVNEKIKMMKIKRAAMIANVFFFTILH